VLSLTAPGVEQLPANEAVALSRESNDYLADCIKKYPTRFAGYASVPTPAPEPAAKELERVVRQYGFKGANINGHNQGRYLDDKFYWPILEAADALKVPIYLHPTPPPQAIIDAYYGGFDPAMTASLTRGGWGWHIETAVHVIRLMLGGVFDRYPNLQVVIGHMGEALPFMLSRMDHQMTMSNTKLQRPISAYLRQNVHYTFSGFTYTPTFLDMLLQVGVDRIMFSCDYPFQSMAETRVFLDQLPVSDIDKERIAHGNAERLFRM
jgi:predicted TIM-barrel fold metal-dependent hydrolase